MVLIWNRQGCSWINRWKVYWQVSEDVLKEGQRYYWGHQVKLQRAPVIETMNDKSSQQLTMPWVISFLQYFSHHCEWNYQTYIIKEIFWHEQSIDQINSACISINCIFDVIRKDYLIKRYRQWGLIALYNMQMRLNLTLWKWKNLVLLLQKWPWFGFSQNFSQRIENSVGRIFLMKCIKQSNIFGFGKQVIVKQQVKREIGYTFRKPWNHLHIADIVFSWSKSSAMFHIWIFCIL